MKTKALKIINLLLAVDFIVIALTAIFNDLIQATGYYYFVHAIPGFIFLILVTSHLILNRKWIKANYFTKK